MSYHRNEKFSNKIWNYIIHLYLRSISKWEKLFTPILIANSDSKKNLHFCLNFHFRKTFEGVQLIYIGISEKYFHLHITIGSELSSTKVDIWTANLKCFRGIPNFRHNLCTLSLNWGVVAAPTSIFSACWYRSKHLYEMNKSTFLLFF